MGAYPRTAEEIEAAVEGEFQPTVDDPPGPIHYLGRTEVAHYLGMVGLASLAGVTLPPPDAVIGDRKGWTPATIDAWNAARPGRGRWGARPAEL